MSFQSFRSFQFQHFIDSFLKLLGPERTLAPWDYDRYFGKMLSKVLMKKLQNRSPLQFVDVWSPKSWSLSLETNCSKDSDEKMDTLLEKTRKLKSDPAIFRPISSSGAHLTWKFFGDCPEPLLSRLSVAMKAMERVPLKTLESFMKTQIKFQGMDYFFKKNKEGVAYLKPTLESVEVIREIEQTLQHHLGFSQKTPFIPHLTLGRIKDKQSFENILKSKMEDLWNEELFYLYPDHFILYRHLDHRSRQAVFGLGRNSP